MKGRSRSALGLLAAGSCPRVLVCWCLCAAPPELAAEPPPLPAPRSEPTDTAPPATSSEGRPAACPEDLCQFISQKLLSVTVREHFANRWVATESTEQGPVRDRVLGADVVGVQLTRARTELDFVPCAEAARMFLHLRGSTMNRTTSWTPQAVIQSEGNYRFQLSKQIDFDGQMIGTRTPAAFLETRQRNLSACTPGAGIPVVGPLISMVAFYAAEQQRPLAERIAAFRLTQSMAPQFNDAIDEQLAGLNGQLESLRSSAAFGLFGSRQAPSARTTDDCFQAGIGQVPDSAAPLPPIPDAPLLVVLNQELVNDWLEGLSLDGKELSDAVLHRLLKQFYDDPLSFGAAPPDDFQPTGPPSFATIRFVGPRPVSIDVDEGTIRLTVLASFRPVLGPEIPAQRIVLALSPKLEGEQCEVRFRLVEIAPADPVAHPTLGELTASLLKQQIEQRLEPARIPRAALIPGSTGPKAIRLDHLLARDGWLILGYGSDDRLFQ